MTEAHLPHISQNRKFNGCSTMIYVCPDHMCVDGQYDDLKHKVVIILARLQYPHIIFNACL